MDVYATALDRLQYLVDKIDVPEEVDATLQKKRQKALLRSVGTLVNLMQEGNEKLITKTRHFERIIQAQKRFMKSLGFDTRATGMNEFYYTNRLRCRCGAVPAIEETCTQDGWLVVCPRCELRTQSFKKVVDAVKAWQKSEFTEISLMLKTKLTKDNVDDDGILALVEAVIDVASDDYICGKEEERKRIRTFFKTSPLTKMIDPEAAIKELDNRARKRIKKAQNAGLISSREAASGVELK